MYINACLYVILHAHCTVCVCTYICLPMYMYMYICTCIYVCRGLHCVKGFCIAVNQRPRFQHRKRLLGGLAECGQEKRETCYVARTQKHFRLSVGDTWYCFHDNQHYSLFCIAVYLHVCIHCVPPKRLQLYFSCLGECAVFSLFSVCLFYICSYSRGTKTRRVWWYRALWTEPCIGYDWGGNGHRWGAF